MDMSIKTAEASIWIDDVNAELDCVANVLRQTKECLEHDPEDDIWFEIERIVKNLDNYWEGLIKAFKFSCSSIKEAIQSAERIGGEVIDFIKESESRLNG